MAGGWPALAFFLAWHALRAFAGPARELHGFPQLPVPYGPDVEAWWADHPFNPKAAGCVPIGTISSPEPVIRVRPEDLGGIQAALDALPASGGTVFFEPGTYRGDFQLIAKSNVHFISNGGAVIRARGSIAGCALALHAADINAWLVNNNDSPTRREARACVTSNRIRNIYFKNLIFDGGSQAGQSLRVVASDGIGNRTHGIRVFLHQDTSPTNCEDPKGSMTVGRYTVRDNHILGQTDKEARLVWEGPLPAAGPNVVTNNFFGGR